MPSKWRSAFQDTQARTEATQGSDDKELQTLNCWDPDLFLNNSGTLKSDLRIIRHFRGGVLSLESCTTGLLGHRKRRIAKQGDHHLKGLRGPTEQLSVPFYPRPCATDAKHNPTKHTFCFNWMISCIPVSAHVITSCTGGTCERNLAVPGQVPKIWSIPTVCAPQRGHCGSSFDKPPTPHVINGTDRVILTKIQALKNFQTFLLHGNHITEGDHLPV